MAQKQVRAQVTLLGNVDPSVINMGKKIKEIQDAISRFGWRGGMQMMGRDLQYAGREIESMGYRLNRLSMPIIRMGKDMMEVTGEYRQGLNEIGSVTKYQGDELEKIGEKLREFAVISRFTPTQTTESFAELMRAGVKVNDGLALMPDIIDFATASNLDLKMATDAMINSLYATGTPFENSRHMLDVMSTVAVKTNTTIDGLAQSIIRMGATTRYFGSNEELLSWLGVLGNLGMQGSEAGTHLRNVMLALAAPTKKAHDLLNNLGIDEGDISNTEINELQDALDSLANDGTIDRLQNGLKELNVDVYDSQGKFRPMVDVLNDLNSATSGLTEQKRNEIMSNLFPKRTLASATGMISSIDLFGSVYKEVTNDIEGEAKRQSEAMDAGIVGMKYYLESAITDLKISFGEAFSGDFIKVADKVREIAVGISNMDEGKKQSLLNLFKTIAISGPATIVAGKAIGGIGKLLTVLANPAGAWGTLLVGAAIGTGLLVAELNRLEDVRLENMFGSAEIDMALLKEQFDGMAQSAFASLTPFKQFDTKLASILDSYKTNLTGMQNIIQSSMLGGAELSQEDKEKINTYVKGLSSALEESLQVNMQQSESFVNMLFADDPTKQEEYKAIFDNFYSSRASEATAAKATLENAMKIALADGIIDFDEKTIIDDALKKYSGILAQVEQGIAGEQLQYELSRALRLKKGDHVEALKVMQDSIAEHSDYMYDLVDRQGAKITDPVARKTFLDKGYADTDKKVFDLALPTMEYLAYDLLQSTGGEDNKASKAFAKQAMQILPADKLRDIILSQYNSAGSVDAGLVNLAQIYGGTYNAWAGMFGGNEGTVLGQLSYLGHKQKTSGDINEALDEMNYQKYIVENDVKLLPAVNGEDGAQAIKDKINEMIAAAEGIQAVIEPEIFIKPQTSMGGINLGGLGSNVKTPQLYAEGGRATMASIFGEAGPEWAIPERHDSRTLALLSSAAKASGFSAQEVAGSMNGDSIHFAPVINVQGDADESSIERAISMALEKFEKILERKKHNIERLSF